MAKIEIIKAADQDSPCSVECLEVNIWGVGGRRGQQFEIGSGVNFDASGDFWLEIRYSLQEIPLFYSRNILTYLGPHDTAGLEAELEKFLSEEYGGFGFGDMLPETSIMLKRTKSSYTGTDNEIHDSVQYSLKICADIGRYLATRRPASAHWTSASNPLAWKTVCVSCA